MIIGLVEIIAPMTSEAYQLREVFVNSDHIVCLREELKIDHKKLPDGLNSKQRYTRVYMNRGQVGIDFVVVGHPELVEKKLNAKQLLKG